MTARYETIVAGSTAQGLELRLLDGGEAIDLSAAVVTLRAVSVLPPYEVRIDGAEAAGDEDGICRYQPTAEDVGEPGDFRVQWAVALSDGRLYVGPEPGIPWRISPAV